MPYLKIEINEKEFGDLKDLAENFEEKKKELQDAKDSNDVEKINDINVSGAKGRFVSYLNEISVFTELEGEFDIEEDKEKITMFF